MPIAKTEKTYDSSPKKTAPDAQFGLLEWDVRANTITICPYLAHILAFKTTDITQKYSDYLELTYPEDLQSIRALYEKIIRKETVYVVAESRKLCRDGKWHWIGLRGKIVEFDSDGNPVRGIGTCTDITHFKVEEQKFNQMKLLFAEINRIKEHYHECHNVNFASHSANADTSIYSEILKSFERLTHSSSSFFIFSSSKKPDEFNMSNKTLHGLDERNIDELEISPEKISFIKKHFHNKKNAIQNSENVSFIGVHLNLPFEQKVMIVLERSEPFEDTLLDFLEPIIGTATYILSIKRHENNRVELNTILSFFIKHALSPVAMFDTEMRHKFVNDAWKRSNRLIEDHECIGKTHYELYPNQPPLWREQHQRALNGEIVKWSPAKIDDHYGEAIWYEGIMLPWYTLSGEIGGIIIYTTIVTERMEAENNLRITVENLRRSNQALDRFAYVCSHDLKEPLRSIANFIQLLFSHNAEQFDEESLVYMRHTLKGVERMNTLIKDILSYSETVEQSGHERVPLNMNKILNDINESFDYRLSEIGAQLKVGVLPTILAVSTQINQLFTNLISNAIKFCSEKPLVIEIFTVEHDHFWEFHVRDNGIGIAEEYHKSIFTMFKRLHSKNQYEGSGIGLATCQKIVNDYDGEIYVQSAVGAGSDFVFTLPKMNE